MPALSTPKPVALITIEHLEHRSYLSVDLAAAVSLVVPSSGTVKTGSAVVISVKVTNDGDTTASGPLEIDPGLSLSSSGSAPVTLKTASQHINLKSTGSTTFKLHETIPLGTAAGTYFGVATIDPNNTFSETTLSNNTAVSTNTIVVSPKYPDIIGTYTGSELVKTGAAKGEVFTKTIVISSENPATGAYLFTGTDHFTNGTTSSNSGSGKISTSGSFTATSVDVPADSSKTTHVHGKFSGDTVTVFFSNDLATGSGTLTLES